MTTTQHLPATPAALDLKQRFKCAAAWSIAGAIVSKVLNMTSWVICARVLGKVAFGQLSIVQSTSGAFGVLAGMGLGLTSTKYIAELRDSDLARAGRILGLSQLVAIVSGFGISSVVIAIAPMLASRTLGAPDLKWPLIIGSGLVLFGALNGFQTGALAGFEAFATIAKVNFWAGLLSFPPIVIGAKIYGVAGAVAGFVVALGISWTLNQLALRRHCWRAGVRFTTAGCLTELPLLLHFSLPALLASALVSPAMWFCDALLVRQPNGFAELGVYGAADRWRLAILFVPASLAGPVLSLLSNLQGNGDSSAYRKVFRANLAITAAIVGIPAAVLACMSPSAMYLFGRGYRDGGRVLTVLSFSTIVEALNTNLGQPLVTKSMWRRFGFDAVLVSTLLIAGWFLIPRWRSLGLAASYALAFLITTALLSIYHRTRNVTQ